MGSLAGEGLGTLEHWLQLLGTVGLGQLGREALGSPKPRRQVSVMVSRMYPCVFQLLIERPPAERIPNGLFPSTQQRQQHKAPLAGVTLAVCQLQPKQQSYKSQCPPFIQTMFCHPIQKTKAGQCLKCIRILSLLGFSMQPTAMPCNWC